MSSENNIWQEFLNSAEFNSAMDNLGRHNLAGKNIWEIEKSVGSAENARQFTLRRGPLAINYGSYSKGSFIMMENSNDPTSFETRFRRSAVREF